MLKLLNSQQLEKVTGGHKHGSGKGCYNGYRLREVYYEFLKDNNIPENKVTGPNPIYADWIYLYRSMESSFDTAVLVVYYYLDENKRLVRVSSDPVTLSGADSRHSLKHKHRCFFRSC